MTTRAHLLLTACGVVLLLPAYLLAGFVWGGWIALRDLWWADVQKAMKTTTDDDDDKNDEDDDPRVVTTGGSRILPYRRAKKGTPYAAQ